MSALILTLALLTAPQKLAAAPEVGLDADVTATLDTASSAITAKDARADEDVLALLLSQDRFTKAQRPRFAPRSADLLRGASELRMQSGELELAARDLDAAWQLSGRGTDPKLADLLVRWSERLKSTDKAGALFLARRARLADPGNPAAADLDGALSNNPLRVPGYALAGLGVAGLISGVLFAVLAQGTKKEIESGAVRSRLEWDGLLAQNGTYRWVSIGSFVAAAVGYLTSMLVLSVGAPRYEPTSPVLLPALPEESR